MVSRANLVTVFLLLPCMMLLITGTANASNKGDCEALAGFVAGLTDEAFNQPITATPPALAVTATWYADTETVPEYCEVKGRIFPEIDFAVRMPVPANWNGRAIHNGGGGWDGRNISNPNDTTNAHVLELGYPWSSSDGGHDGNNGQFTVKDPYYDLFFGTTTGNPYACQKIVDFGNRAHRETPLLARKIYKQYYGSLPAFFYYNGASTGGREGLVEAQKNYDLFDGIYIGRPTGGHVAVCTRGIWNNVQAEAFTNNHTIPPGSRELFADKAIVLRNAVYDKCDGIDGLVDGVIDDPRQCEFDPLTELPPCPGDVNAAGCFTLAQRKALKEIYRGPHNSKGKPYYVGQPLGAEYLTDPANPNSHGFGAALLDGYANDIVRYAAWDPPPGPNWDMMTFNWDTDVQLLKDSTCTQCYPDGSCKTYKLTDELDAVTLSYPVKPNMGGFAPFKAKGGKIIHNHGWADSLVSAFTSVSLYESVMKKMGIDETKSFWKLYMVPGLPHGTSGGIGWGIASWDDGFGALVNWVENGDEPYALLGSRRENAKWGWPETTRPLCPYPEVARYSGTADENGNPTGSIYTADNFMCVPPIEVRIEPETLNLKSKGEFTAFITVPEGYDIRDWNIGNLECEGAPMLKGVLSGNTCTAKFNKEDLVGVAAGDAVTLTVKGTFTPDGNAAQIQASDTVRVIE